MQSDYMLVSLVVFLGIWIGVIISRVCPEELVPGRIYFVWSRNLLLSSVLAIAVYLVLSSFFIPVALMVISIILAFLVLYLMFRIRQESGWVSSLVSFASGVAFFVSYGSGLFLVVSSALLLFFSLHATLFISRFVKKGKFQVSLLYMLLPVSLMNITFFVCLLLPFLFPYL